MRPAVPGLKVHRRPSTRRRAPVRPRAPLETRPARGSPSVNPGLAPLSCPTQLTVPPVQMRDIHQTEADFQDPREAEDSVDEQDIWVEEEEGASPLSPSSSSSSSSSSSYSVWFLGTGKEAANSGTPSPTQSPQGVCPSPTAVAAPPWSQSEDNGLRSQGEERPSTGQDPADAESSHPDPFHLKVADLVGFLLLKYRTKEPTTKEDMLNAVLRADQDHFAVVLSQASECLQLVFGVDVNEVDPREHLYVLVPTLGLTCDGMLGGGQSLPKNGLLVMLLGVILLEGECATEEKMWEALSVMGVYPGREHCIYGEPRELITNVWVREEYVDYQQVPSSDPPRYELLWGPRAHAETSKLQVLEHFLRVNTRNLCSFLSLSEEVLSDEEEWP
ncbi:melanoma-associated antigen 8-like [Vicugna pacos]|uniref:Melanoma-associated antigen 8-like n=1 Tax=Vicugna pacos TaxID=30538 RepID=A0ABM5D0A1_VICPA|nr:melanoma-associated antigen 8-like [Vicugna pacos]